MSESSFKSTKNLSSTDLDETERLAWVVEQMRDIVDIGGGVYDAVAQLKRIMIEWVHDGVSRSGKIKCRELDCRIEYILNKRRVNGHCISRISFMSCKRDGKRNRR